jgi:hypothetical protein
MKVPISHDGYFAAPFQQMAPGYPRPVVPGPAGSEKPETDTGPRSRDVMGNQPPMRGGVPAKGDAAGARPDWIRI